MNTTVPGVQYNLIHFPGGESHVQITGGGPTVSYTNQYAPKELPLVINARVRNGQDLMDLLVLNDALRRRFNVPIHLRLPYFPGARQDRAQNGEALTVKVVADLINACNFASVEILDPHSDVVVALLDRVKVRPLRPILDQFLFGREVVGLIAPDVGASKRVQKLAEELKLKFKQGFKHRDPTTGKLSGFSCEHISQEGRWVIVDDICDGGGTFIGLADHIMANKCWMRWANPQVTLDLWVTHGIFSKGLGALWGYFNRIGTTDSFCTAVTFGRFTVIPV